MKKALSVFLALSIIFSYTICFGEEIALDFQFDNLDGWVATVPDTSAGEVAEVSMENAADSLHINNTTTAATSAKYVQKTKYEFNYVFEFKIKIVKNTGNIIAQVMVGKERTQLNITNGGKSLMIPTTDQSGTTTRPTINLEEKITNYNANEWHTWRVEGTNNNQVLTIDGTEVFNGGTQRPWSNDLTIEFFANAGENDIYVKDCKFGEIDQALILNENFSGLTAWNTTGSKVEVVGTAPSQKVNALKVNNKTTEAVSVKYNEKVKYSTDYILEFKTKIIKNTGYIIIQVLPGIERTQLNITNGGNSLMIPTTDENGVINRPTINLTSIMGNYNPSNWNVWKVTVQRGIQTITINDIEVFSGGTQKPWNSDMTIEFFANNGENEYYVDYCKFNVSEGGEAEIPDPDFPILEVPPTYGKSNVFFNLAQDSVDKWTSNNDNADKLVEITQSGVHVKRSGAEGDFSYANRDIPNVTNNMILNFNMQIPAFSKENTLMLRNSNCRIQIMYYPNKIQYRNSSGGVTDIAIDIGNDWHNWTYVLQEKTAQIYMDNVLVANYVVHDVSATPLLQIVCNNKADQVAEMNVKDIVISNISGSLLYETDLKYGEDVATKLIDDTLVGTINIKNLSSQDSTGLAMLMLYDENQKIIGINFKPFNIKKVQQNKIEVSIPVDSTAKTATLFCWRNLISRRPIAKAITLHR